uniref:Ycf34 n=1 Tax=Polysiphonia sp. TaxID=1967842 RepID=A0A1Z1MT83_9FLOR|nr:hypothetical protein [Polysiphonia sp.]
MCICINCRHINKCRTYKFIEKQHYSNKKLIKSLFTPIKTTIVITINKKNNKIFLDWDLKECSSFVEEPGYWLPLF